MRINRLLIQLATFSLLGLGACSKDNVNGGGTPPDDSSSKKYVIAGMSATAEESKQYLFLADRLDEGEITVKGNGYETAGGTMYALNNKAVTFKYNRGDPGNAEVFQLGTDNLLKKTGAFNIKSVNVFLPFKAQDHLIAYNIGRSLTTPGTAYWVNIADNRVDKTLEVDQKLIYVDGKHVDNYFGWPYAMFEFGDKIYAPLSPAYGGTGVQDKADYKDHAFVAIFDKNLKFEKTIEDKRMPFIGQYYNTIGLGQVSTGDIYAFSNGDVESSNNHSAFLKIKNDAFDKDYYWDVEAVANMRIRAGFFIKDNKFVLVMVPRDAKQAEASGVKLAIADVVKKEFKWISGVETKITDPGYGFPLFTTDGKSYLPMQEGQSSISFLYVIDADNYTAKRGLKLTGIKDITGVGMLKK